MGNIMTDEIKNELIMRHILFQNRYDNASIHTFTIELGKSKNNQISIYPNDEQVNSFLLDNKGNLLEYTADDNRSKFNITTYKNNDVIEFDLSVFLGENNNFVYSGDFRRTIGENNTNQLIINSETECTTIEKDQFNKYIVTKQIYNIKSKEFTLDGTPIGTPVRYRVVIICPMNRIAPMIRVYPDGTIFDVLDLEDDSCLYNSYNNPIYVTDSRIVETTKKYDDTNYKKLSADPEFKNKIAITSGDRCEADGYYNDTINSSYTNDGITIAGVHFDFFAEAYCTIDANDVENKDEILNIVNEYSDRLYENFDEIKTDKNNEYLYLSAKCSGEGNYERVNIVIKDNIGILVFKSYALSIFVFNFKDCEEIMNCTNKSTKSIYNSTIAYNDIKGLGFVVANKDLAMVLNKYNMEKYPTKIIHSIHDILQNSTESTVYNSNTLYDKVLIDYNDNDIALNFGSYPKQNPSYYPAIDDDGNYYAYIRGAVGELIKKTKNDKGNDFNL